MSEHDWRLYDRDDLFVCQRCGLFRGDDAPLVCAGPAHATAAVATTAPVMAAPQPPLDYEAKFERIAGALAAENERLHARLRELESVAAGLEPKAGDTFYSYDPDGTGFEEHDTAEEAQAAAEEALQNCADEASDGWPAGTSSIHWGRLLPLGVIVEESGTAEQDSQARVAGFSGWVNFRFAAQPDEVALLRAQVAALTAERDQAQANYRFMVESAADQRLDGYRELGARAAAAENERDSQWHRTAIAEANCSQLRKHVAELEAQLDTYADEDEVSRLRDRIAALEAPPVVPNDYEVHKADLYDEDGNEPRWELRVRDADDNPIVVAYVEDRLIRTTNAIAEPFEALAALAWAAKNDQRPLHEREVA